MSSHKNNQVSAGSSVLVLLNGKKIRYKIVSSSETNPEEHMISNISPLGKALLGAEPGEEVKFSVRDREKNVKVLEVN
jgi:transcription elongation factor GreA